MLALVICAVSAANDDDSVKKEYGIMIQNVLKDEIQKSWRALQHQRLLRDQALDSVNFAQLERKELPEVVKLKQQIRELRKQVRQAEWEDVKTRLEHKKKILKEKLRTEMQNVVPVTDASVAAPFGTTYTGIRTATNGARRHRK